MKRRAVTKAKAGKVRSTRSKVKSSKPPVVRAELEENVCDAVHRVIRKAKTVTPAIRSLKAWYAENC